MTFLQASFMVVAITAVVLGVMATVTVAIKAKKDKKSPAEIIDSMASSVDSFFSKAFSD